MTGERTIPPEPSPVGTVPVVTSPVGGRSRAHVIVPATEEVFAGHYPGAPILPGVCVVEYVRLAVLCDLAEQAGGRWLSAIESCRFLRPIHPGERLDIDWTWASGDQGRCSAVVRIGSLVAARLRLSFGDLGRLWADPTWHASSSTISDRWVWPLRRPRLRESPRPISLATPDSSPAEE